MKDAGDVVRVGDVAPRPAPRPAGRVARPRDAATGPQRPAWTRYATDVA